MHRAALDAHLASLKLWLADLALWLTEALSALGWRGLAAAWKREMRAELLAAGFALRCAAMCAAHARLGPRRRPIRRTPRPASAPRGFRARRVRGGALRMLTRAALRGLHAGNLRQRIARLRALLDNLEPAIARILKRIARGRRGFRLSPASPPALHLISDGASDAPACAAPVCDTS
jgi:hypothetical protein